MLVESPPHPPSLEDRKLFGRDAAARKASPATHRESLSPRQLFRQCAENARAPLLLFLSNTHSPQKSDPPTSSESRAIFRPAASCCPQPDTVPHCRAPSPNRPCCRARGCP